jgi:hypothetical protein
MRRDGAPAAAAEAKPQTAEQIRALVRESWGGTVEEEEDDGDAECFSRPPAARRTPSFAPAGAGAAKPPQGKPAAAAAAAAVTLIPAKSGAGGGGGGKMAAVFGMCKALAKERDDRNAARPIDCDRPPLVDLTVPRVQPTGAKRMLASIFQGKGCPGSAFAAKGRGGKAAAAPKEQPKDCVVRGRDGATYYVDAAGKRTPCDVRLDG